MIVTTSFLAISLIIGFIFLGIKMSANIQHGDIKVFFFTLYTITLLTLINIVISFYFYNKTIKKRGHKGNRGLQGKVGDKGDSGYCQPSCKKESLKMLLVNEYKKVYPDDNEIEETVCGFFANTDKDADIKIQSLELEDFNEIKNNINFETPVLPDLSDLSNLLEKNREHLETDENPSIIINYTKGPLTLNYSNQC
jgi:hypothetical protein